MTVVQFTIAISVIMILVPVVLIIGMVISIAISKKNDSEEDIDNELKKKKEELLTLNKKLDLAMRNYQIMNAGVVPYLRMTPAELEVYLVFVMDSYIDLIIMKDIRPDGGIHTASDSLYVELRIEMDKFLSTIAPVIENAYGENYINALIERHYMVKTIKGEIRAKILSIKGGEELNIEPDDITGG